MSTKLRSLSPPDWVENRATNRLRAGFGSEVETQIRAVWSLIVSVREGSSNSGAVEVSSKFGHRGEESSGIETTNESCWMLLADVA